MASRNRIKGLSQFLRERRRAKKITQLSAAEALGHSTAQYISNFERGLCEPSLETALKLCVCYGISKRELYDLMVQSYRVELKYRIFKETADESK